jgi:TM2 domain-containing membrane protein YozV
MGIVPAAHPFRTVTIVTIFPSQPTALQLKSSLPELPVNTGSQQKPPRIPPVQSPTVIIINQVPDRKWSPGVAALLSLLIPGVGQAYKGQVVNGIAWFVMVVVGYLLLILPGIILHLCCIIGAASGNPSEGVRTTVVRQ